MKKSQPTIERLEVRRQKGQIWSHVRKKWLNETPEEAVRQEYLCVLVNEYGFKLEQIDEEATLPGKRGNKHARADFVIWRTVEEKRNGEEQHKWGRPHALTPTASTYSHHQRGMTKN